MFLMYSIEDVIMLNPEELNINLKYEEVLLNKARKKYIGKVKIIILTTERFLMMLVWLLL